MSENCPICGAVFQTQEDLEDHIRLFHAEEYRRRKEAQTMGDMMQPMKEMLAGYAQQEGAKLVRNTALELTKLALQYGKPVSEVYEIYDWALAYLEGRAGVAAGGESIETRKPEE